MACHVPRKLLASTNLRSRVQELPKILTSQLDPAVALKKQMHSGHFDLTSRHVFDTTPESVLHAAISQVVQPRTADVLANGLRQKYAEVADGSFDHFDFHANHKEALVGAITKIMQATNRSRVIHVAGIVPEGLEMVKNANIMTFLADVDSWSDSIALGVFHQKLSNSHPHTVAALIMSPFSSHNGFKPYSRDYLIGCQDLCDRYGIQLIVDETDVGLGRTGPAFAFSHFKNFQPDMLITTAPSTTFLPVTVVCSKTKRALPSMDIHPVAMASANAAIDYFMDNDLPSRTMEKSRMLHKKLRVAGDASWVYGLCGGVKLKEPTFASQTLREDAHIAVGQQLGGVNFKLPLLTPDEELTKLAHSLVSASTREELQPWDASLPLAEA